jgi:hypothetical protein
MPRSENLPYQFLLKASVSTLESFELSRLNHAANLKKQIEDLIEQYLDESTAALLARAMILRMHRSRPDSVNKKRQLPAPRPISTARELTFANSIPSGYARSPERRTPAPRSGCTGRLLPRAKGDRESETQQNLPFDLLRKSCAR